MHNRLIPLNFFSDGLKNLLVMEKNLARNGKMCIIPMLVKAASLGGWLGPNDQAEKGERNMRKISTLVLGGMAAVGALVLSPAAQAGEPITLTSVQMDGITAGSAKYKHDHSKKRHHKHSKKPHKGGTNFVFLAVDADALVVSNQQIASATLTATVTATLAE